MPNHASCTIIGHLGRDAETKYLPGDKCVVSFTVATSRKRKDEETTTWWRCQFWGDRAAKLSEYLTKGKAVMVQGEVHQREYETKDGIKGHSLEVEVRELVLLGDGKAREESAQHAAAPAPRHVPRHVGGGFDDDSPPFARSEWERMP
jgi:single-strand DNA-binding protein